MSIPWRLIISPPASGAYNMVLDEVLLLRASRKETLPTLRLYSWDPPTLSLGYAQNWHEVNLEALDRLGWGLVRRPTGGRAILHTDELTYSVTAPLDHPVAQGTLLESYQRLSQALLNALRQLEIEAQADNLSKPSAQRNTEPVCFEVPSNYEITFAGKKLVGSAQARKSGGMLQHGSLPLFGDLSRICQVLYYQNEAERTAAITRLNAHAGTVLSLTQKRVSLQQAEKAFVAAFSSTLSIDFTISEPDSTETAETELLVQSKYGSDEWNKRL